MTRAHINFSRLENDVLSKSCRTAWKFEQNLINISISISFRVLLPFIVIALCVTRTCICTHRCVGGRRDLYTWKMKLMSYLRLLSALLILQGLYWAYDRRGRSRVLQITLLKRRNAQSARPRHSLLQRIRNPFGVDSRAKSVGSEILLLVFPIHQNRV